MTESEAKDRQLWREIWALALQLSGSRGRPQLAAWLLCADSAAALLGDGVDARFLSDTIFQLEAERQKQILGETR